jgi:hypothetical protein
MMADKPFDGFSFADQLIAARAIHPAEDGVPLRLAQNPLPPRSIMKVLLLVSLLASALAAHAAPLNRTVLYITQTPMPDDSLSLTHDIAGTRLTVASTMQSPLADTTHVARGGALWIRYPGALSATNPRNLTAAAGYGGSVDGNNNATGFQGANSIAVQRPFVHWNGAKAIFAMIVGAPLSASDTTQFHWQLYEITNFAQGQTPVISYVTGQPAAYNNYQACYDTQDRIVFVSDAPIGMQAHLYPQLDEYMSLPCNTGLWQLDRTTNQVKQIVHAPSGAFSPFIDSAGRVMFVQWDHLSRDVFATYDRSPIVGNGDLWTQTFNGNGNFDSEGTNAPFTLGTAGNYATYNYHPEPRNFDKTAFVGTNLNSNSFNQFFPWECREDGSSHEVQNHVGRHEFGGSQAKPSFNDDDNLVPLTFAHATALNFLHVTESPSSPGTFYAVSPPEVGTHVAGPILTYTGPLGQNPDTMSVTYLTSTTAVPNTALGQSPLGTPVDIYRNPTPLSDGSMLTVHAAVTQYDTNSGTASQPKSRYDFRLRMMMASGSTLVPDTANNPTSPQNVNLSYYAGSSPITYSGAHMWELDPVEVIDRSATKPAQLTSSIASVEQTVFDEEMVHAPTFQNYLRTHNLALVVNRNSTRRDAADKQQPFNLKIATSITQTLGAVVPGVPQKIYDIGWVQLLQADALRGYTLDGQNVNASPLPGRRFMPNPLHSTLNEMPAVAGAPSGAVKLGDDGSWAAVLPAGRAVSWQMMDGAGTKSQVKERYWVSFAPGELRTCAVCHGVNTADQAGNLGVPVNKPDALRSLLQYWRANNPPGSMQHAAPAASVLKNAGTALLSVTRTGGGTGPVSVNFSTANGTALASTDYTATSGTLTWADGDTTPKTIAVSLLNNPTIAASKSLTVSLASPLYGSLGATMVKTLTLAETPLDAWRFANFGANANTPGYGQPADDADRDGQDNQSEFLAGTSPTDASSVFAAQAILNGGQVHLTFTAQPGVAYTVQYKNALSDATWLKFTDVSAPASAQSIDIVDTLSPQRFYRVVTPPAP